MKNVFPENVLCGFDMYIAGRDVTGRADRNDAGLAIAFFTELSASSLVLGIEHFATGRLTVTGAH
jgi:hypothetical protein